MKRTPLTAMLTALAVLAASIAIAGCGGKSSSNSTSTTKNTTTTEQPGKKKSKPGY
jgi:ABC-type glycerol-3-phosphate transport system substrate-binding protein